ncbi:MAG: hypothetical protein ACM3Q2_04140 [Syntrophothermus sp.]
MNALIIKEVINIAKDMLENKIDIVKASDLISSYHYDLDPDWNDSDLTRFWVISDDFSYYSIPPELMEENYRHKQMLAREELLAICTPEAIMAAENIIRKYKDLP